MCIFGLLSYSCENSQWIFTEKKGGKTEVDQFYLKVCFKQSKKFFYIILIMMIYYHSRCLLCSKFCRCNTWGIEKKNVIFQTFIFTKMKNHFLLFYTRCFSPAHFIFMLFNSRRTEPYIVFWNYRYCTRIYKKLIQLRDFWLFNKSRKFHS